MEKEVKFLKEWIVRYVKNKDLIVKKISSIDEKDDELIVIKGEKLQKYVIVPFISDLEKLKQRIEPYEHSKSIVCFHTRKNFEFFLDNWPQFVDFGRFFSVYFVNPFSKTDKALSINPFTHQLISDPETLKLGLKTLAENVEFAAEEEVKKIVNS